MEPLAVLRLEDLQDVASYMSWSDLLFALRHGLVLPQTVVDLATSEVHEHQQGPTLDLALLLADDLDEVERILTQHAELPVGEDFTESDHKTRRLWMFLVLRRACRTVTDDHSALEAIERVYNAFEYPEELRGLIWRLPGTGPGDTDDRVLASARSALQVMEDEIKAGDGERRRPRGT